MFGDHLSFGCCLLLLSGGKAFAIYLVVLYRAMPLSYFFRGGAVRFSFFLVAFGLTILFLDVFFGLCPFGNKFLIIQNKKRKLTLKALR